MTIDRLHADALVHLVRGDDPVLVAERVVALIDALVGDGDRSLMLEELDAARWDAEGGERHLGALVDAAGTPPFLTERRVVVGRQLGAFTRAAEVEGLLRYLEDPLPTTALVLAWEPHPGSGVRSGPPPKKLLDALKAAGGVVHDTSAGAGKAYASWIGERLDESSLTFDREARALIAEQIGEDASRLVGLLPLLESVYGPGARMGRAEVEPYLGEGGAVKPWELTDAIDRGDETGAIAKLQRMLGAGIPAFVVMANLINHFTRIAALDGAGATDERAAAEVLGMKGSTFPAKKALAQSRKLGADRVREVLQLLAQADLDLRGAKALPNDVVLEVLVARLAFRSKA